jgi:hypothetical protein
MLCRLWKRIGTETADSDALTGEAGSKRSAALDKIRSIIACDL